MLSVRKQSIIPRALVFAHALFLLVVISLPVGCSSKKPSATPQRKVVVYTSLDREYSAPILKIFEDRTGIAVECVYDGETSKTTGLANRLLARKDRPDCDVYWNNELLQTRRLAELGLFQAYRSPQASRYGDRYLDKQNRYACFAARARVIVYDKRAWSTPPKFATWYDLCDSSLAGKVVMGKPLFGTVLTQMAALQCRWGPAKIGQFLDALSENRIALAPGNGPACKMVAGGEFPLGLTDTDDAWGRIVEQQGQGTVNLGVTVPAEGTFLIPNTLSLVRNGPHSEEGKRLIDFLLSAEVEKMLAAGPSAQIPLAKDLREVKTPLSATLGKFLDLQLPDAAGYDELVRLLRQKGMDR